MKFPELLRDVPAQSKVQVRALLAAWAQTARAPLPAGVTSFINAHKLHARQQLRYLPLVYAVIGLAGSLAYLISEALTGGKSLSVLVALLAVLAISGGLNPKPAFKATLTLLVTWQLLALLPSHLIFAALIAAPAFASFTAYAFLYTHRPAMPNMHGRFSLFRGTHLENNDFIIMAGLGMLPITLLGHAAFMALPVTLWIARAAVGIYLMADKQRYDSDALTIVRQGTEVSFYAGLAIITHLFTGL